MRHSARIILALIGLLLATPSLAQEGDKDLAQLSLNPLKVNYYAQYISLPFENDINFGYGPKNSTQDVLSFKPVIPFQINSSYSLIFRAIAPLYERTATYNQQNVINGRYINGWGDLNPTLFFSPTRFRTINWGIGPTAIIPTSSNNLNIGAGKWSIGPSLVIMVVPGNWVFGFLTSNVWSVAGASYRPTVSTFTFQYWVSYVLDKGWYISTNPTITANWKYRANQRWLVPFGVGGGRSFHWGKQPFNLSMYGYYNAVRPSGIGPNWQLQFVAEWLFPSKIV